MRRGVTRTLRVKKQTRKSHAPFLRYIQTCEKQHERAYIESSLALGERAAKCPAKMAGWHFAFVKWPVSQGSPACEGRRERHYNEKRHNCARMQRVYVHTRRRVLRHVSKSHVYTHVRPKELALSLSKKMRSLITSTLRHWNETVAIFVSDS